MGALENSISPINGLLMLKNLFQISNDVFSPPVKGFLLSSHFWKSYYLLKIRPNYIQSFLVLVTETPPTFTFYRPQKPNYFWPSKWYKTHSHKNCMIGGWCQLIIHYQYLGIYYSDEWINICIPKLEYNIYWPYQPCLCGNHFRLNFLSLLAGFKHSCCFRRS